MFNGAFGELSEEEETPETEASKEFSCEGSICTSLTPETEIRFLNVQDALNRAAMRLGVGRPLPLTGNICTRTAALAVRVLTAAPSTERVRAWLDHPDTQNLAALARNMAQAPTLALATFDEISGFSHPVPLVDPRRLPARPTPGPPPTPAPMLRPQPQLGADTTSFWSTRNTLLVTAGVLAVSGAGYMVWRKLRGGRR